MTIRRCRAQAAVVMLGVLVGAGLPVSLAAQDAPAPQGPASPPPAVAAFAPANPLMDVGAGVGALFAVASDVDSAYVTVAPSARAGIRLGRRWALEGVFDFWPNGGDLTVIYRVQARRLIRGVAAPGHGQWHLTLGATGSMDHSTWDEMRWTGSDGVVHVYPGGSHWDVMPPIFPTVGIGWQKPLAARVALRADLAAVFVPYDDGVAALILPSLSLTFPFGK